MSIEYTLHHQTDVQRCISVLLPAQVHLQLRPWCNTCVNHNDLGSVHSSCTEQESPSGEAWCATRVDDDGNYIGKWGYCNESACGVISALTNLTIDFDFKLSKV